MPRGQFWYLFVSLTGRGRAVLLGAALAAQIALVAIDYRVHDIMLAALETIPILAWAVCASYRSAILFAAVTALFASMFETQPEPQPLTNPTVIVNAAIFFCGYLIVLGLAGAVAALVQRLRAFLSDFGELKKAHDGLLPDQLPWLGDWEFSVMNVPRRDVGGVFYDIAPWKGGIDLIAGGVSGPVMRAMMILPALKSSWLGNEALPPAALRRLNRRLLPVLKSDTAVRAWYGKLYNNGIIRYASAGFPAPFLVSADGSVRRLSGGGVSLGAHSTGEVAEAMYMLDGGAALILGNDGFCKLVDEELIEPQALLSDRDAVEARVCGRACEDDVLAIVARRKTNFLFKHLFEEPVLNADDPSRHNEPRNSPNPEP